MINKTNRPMLVNDQITGSDLDSAIRKALHYTIQKESEYLGSTDGAPVFRDKQHMRTFSWCFTEELEQQRTFDESFIQAAFDLSQTSHITKLDRLDGLELLLTGKSSEGLNGPRSARIRTGLKTVILHLWSQNALLIPLFFTVERSIKLPTYRDLLSEVAALFFFYDTNITKNPQNHPDLGSWDDTDFDRAHRIIWATNWHSFKEVNIHELSDLHILTLKGGQGIPNTRWNFVSMLKELIHQQESKVSFTPEDVELYRKWIRGSWYVDHTYEYFCKNLPEIRLDSKRRYGQRNAETYRKGLLRRNDLEIIEGMDLSKPAFHIVLEKIAEKVNHDAALEYFTKASGLNRHFASVEPYAGREHIDLISLSKFWLRTFADWLDYRQNRGLEEDGGFVSEIRLLCDYLFCYLPWWIELHPQANFKFPYSPADFERFIFFISTNKPIDEAPLTFKELLKLRRRTINSQGRSISQLHFYFEYLIAHINLYPELMGVKLNNPIVLSIDYPKGRKRSSKTNKVPFPKKVMPYLLRYFYALEEFGIHLQKLALERTLNLSIKLQPKVLNPQDFGYSIQIIFNGSSYPIDEVPNVYKLANRTIKTTDDTTTRVLMPHMSALRILIVGLETGLRMQAIQWLDLRHWDCLNMDKPADLYVYDLFVNTDKTKGEPWVTPLVYRARNVLLREQSFQQSIAEDGMSALVPYENRTRSRFADILPLFRTGGYRGQPVDDSSYANLWTDVLIGFQQFYNSQVSSGEYTQFVTTGPYYLRGIQGVVRVDITADGSSYCPLRFTAIHTPHSARSTYISNRSGLLEVEEISSVVGHTSTIVTHHYMIENYEQLVAKVETADRELWQYNPANPVHIRADKENSALRLALQKDRDETEKRYGFISISLLNQKDDALQDGVELLRTTPMSQITFRETHICPVGETCPENIKDIIYEPRRCGLCPLAVKTVDNLPAITARMRQLLEQVQNSTVLLQKLEERGEPETTLEEINERRKIDALEYTGWLRAFEVLNKTLEEIRSNDSTVFYADEPAIVKQHLKLVSKQSSRVEFILERIMDSEAYPSMQTPELRARANVLRQRLLANLGFVKEALNEIEEGDEVTAFISSMRIALEAHGLTQQRLIDEQWLENKQLSIPTRLSLQSPQMNNLDPLTKMNSKVEGEG